MNRQYVEGAASLLPLFLGFVAHGLCIRLRVGSQLAIPISPRLFGANKTYRGVICVALGTALGFLVLTPSLLQAMDSVQLVLIGLFTGAAAMLAELPNSYLKRRLGIPLGTQVSGVRGFVFHVVDQVDVVFGAWAVLAHMIAPTWHQIAGSILIMYVGHQLISLAGFWLGMRKNPRWSGDLTN